MTDPCGGNTAGGSGCSCDPPFGRKHVEPQPDLAAQLAEARKRLAEAQRQFAASRREIEVPMLLYRFGLAEWDAEMDNCYPGFD